MFWFCEYAEMNMIIQVSLWDTDFASSGYILKSGIGGSDGSFLCNFLKNLHAVFHNGYINLHAHQQNSKYLFSPHPYQHLFSFVFWIIALLTDMRLNIVILICISTMINEPFFIYLLIIGLSSFKKYLCRFLARFLIGLTFCCSSGVAVQLIWY